MPSASAPTPRKPPRPSPRCRASWRQPACRGGPSLAQTPTTPEDPSVTSDRPERPHRSLRAAHRAFDRHRPRSAGPATSPARPALRDERGRAEVEGNLRCLWRPRREQLGPRPTKRRQRLLSEPAATAPALGLVALPGRPALLRASPAGFREAARAYLESNGLRRIVGRVSRPAAQGQGVSRPAGAREGPDASGRRASASRVILECPSSGSSSCRVWR